MNRRHFLGATTLFGLGAGLGRASSSLLPAPASAADVQRAPAAAEVNYAGLRVVAPHGSKADHAFVTDLAAKSSYKFPISSGTHQCLVDESRDRVYAIPRMGRQVSVYNLKNKERMAIINAPENHSFYGHGVISPDRQRILFGQAVRPDGRGVLMIINAETMASESAWESGGKTPHEMLYSADGKSLFVVNGGVKPLYWSSEEGPVKWLPVEGSSIVRMDAATGKILERRDFKLEDEAMGHLAIDGERIAVISAPSEPKNFGKVFLGTMSAGFRELEFPIKRRIPHGQFLSLAFEKHSNLLVVTHPEGEMLSFWDVTTGALVKSLPISSHGVCVPSPGYVLVNTIHNARGILIRTTDWDTQFVDETKIGNGSHFTVLRA